MLSKNNYQGKARQVTPTKQRYSIRKFSIGAASVLIGLTFTTMINSQQVQAATDKNKIDNEKQDVSKVKKDQPIVNQTLAVKKTADNVSVKENTVTSNEIKNIEKPIAAKKIESKTNDKIQTQTLTVNSNKVNNSSNNEAKILTAQKDVATKTQDTSIAKENIADVNSWADLTNALSNPNITTINLNGNIVATNNIQITGNRTIAINGASIASDAAYDKNKNANISFGNYTLNSNGQLNLTFNNTNISSTSMTGAIDLKNSYGSNSVTFNNVSSTGSALYNGGGNTVVNIKGIVESNVDMSAPAGYTSIEGNKVNDAGARSDYVNRRPTNIAATNVNIEDSATLKLTRTAQGNGIEVKNGGTVSLGNSADFEVNFSNPEATDAAIQIIENGHFLTGQNSTINLNVGQGRGLDIGQRRGTVAQAHTNLDQYPNYGSYTGTDNRIILGKNTTFNFTGRDAMLTGNHAIFNSGEGSHLTFHNHGNGVAFDAGDDSQFIVAPHSVLNFNSEGKDGSGDWCHANYIGLNENSSITVQHDGQLFLDLVGRGKHFYNDTINLDSRKPTSRALFYVGDNAVVSVQSDGTDYFPELISVPLGNPQADFIFDNVRYVNLQKNSVILGHANNPNLIFMSGNKGSFTGKGLYKIYQWDKKNFTGRNVNYTSADDQVENYQNLQKQLEGLANNTWTGVTSFSLPWSNFNPQHIKGVGLASLMSNHGVAFTDRNHGFNPQTSQRLVITSMTIPAQESTTKKTPIPYTVEKRYSEDLKPGQVRIVQKGVDGYKETTTTTYYNITTTPDGNITKVIDKSKGNDGVTVTTKTVDPVKEIIDWGGPLPSSVTVHYEIAGNDPSVTAPKDTVEDGYKFDVSNIKPDGTLVWTSTSHTYPGQDLPVVEGYTPYYEGKPITDGKIPNVTVTIADPNKEITITYQKNAPQESTASVIYKDITEDKVLQTKDLSGEVGQVSDYRTAATIAQYEAQGYKLQSDNYPVNGVKFAKNPQKFEVDLVHTYDKITPDNPHGLDPKELEQKFTETITYSGAGNLTPAKKVQTSTWTRTLTWDNVERKVVVGDYTTDWTPNIKEYTEVVSPTISGYQANPEKIDAQPTQMKDLAYQVVYTPNGEETTAETKLNASQTIKYEDENHNELKPAKTEHFTFIKSGNVVDKVTGQIIKEGSWNETTHTFNKIDNPVIQGFVTDSTVAGGFTASLDNLNKTIIVVYKPVGKIVPIGPNGKPIPDAPTPKYPNDPTNPTKVIPNEPVPAVPGYKPNKSTVTPIDPTKDTPIAYDYDEAATINFIDIDENDKIIATSGTLIGAPNALIGYDPVATLKQLEEKGYQQVPNGSNYNQATSIFGNKPNGHEIFTIKMQHKLVPVGPNNPNPVPGSNVGKDDYEKNVSETITYKGAGEDTPKPNVQDATWTRTVTVDAVTGKLVENGKYTTDWKANKENYAPVKTPVVKGYYADISEVPETKVTMQDINKLVTYAPVGKIIPVNPDGEPIPNAPTPKYPNDPDDPSKVQPDEPVPEIPGFKPSVPTVTPDNPGKDTKVIYKPVINDQTVKVVFWDQTDNQEIPGYAPHIITTKPGTELTYNPDSTIKAIENEGYKLVHNGYNITTMPKDGGTYRITFEHNIIHVTPNNPGSGYDKKDLEHNVTRTIEYVGPNGNVHDPVVQNDKFTASGYYDEVSKKWVTLNEAGKETGTVAGPTWNPEKAGFKAVVSPTISGMHVVNVSSDRDGDNVASVDNITHETSDYTVIVTYADNGTIDKNAKTVPSTQRVKFVGPNGEEIHSPNKQKFTFNRTPDEVDPVTGQVIKQGKWNEQEHTFKNVNVPVIKGYVAPKAVVDGETTTPQDPDKTITVKYQKVGKIIPVGPDGKPIPNAPTPDYPNDPNNPAGVLPNEPVPDIPGYVPTTPTVTPKDPTKDTTVIYKPVVNDQTVKVVFWDQTDNQEIPGYAPHIITAKPGTQLTYNPDSTIKDIENEGYKLVHNGYNITTMPKDGGTYRITFEHNIILVTPNNPGGGYSKNDLEHSVTRTIRYLGPDGSVHDPVVQSDQFTASGYYDEVSKKWVTLNAAGKETGTLSGPTWNPERSSFKAVKSPIISGMHVVSVSRDADGNNVSGVNNITHETVDYTVIVTYADNGTIDKGERTVPSTQTVKFVGPDGKEISTPNSQKFTFKKSPDKVDPVTGKIIEQGKWNENKHTFKNVNVPVIKGYVAPKAVVDGTSTTPEDPDKTITVKYQKVGKIIPIGPDGKPIPNAPTPDYPNNPDNPTEVKPNEPVPDVPGYVPTTPTVTPKDPTKNTTVIYKPIEKDEQSAVVHYIDQAEDDKIIASSPVLTGKIGSLIDYSTSDEIKKLEAEGYKLVKNDFPKDAKFEENNGKQQVFNVVMTHATAVITPDQPNMPKPGTPINPAEPNGPKWPDSVSKDNLNKTITRRINYVNGQTGEKIADSVTQSVHFGRTIIVDKVTGKVLGYTTDGKDKVTTTDGNKAWQPIGSTTWKKQVSPSVDGYTNPSPSVVEEKKVTPNDKDETISVKYTPVAPGVTPTPTPDVTPEPNPIPQPQPEPTPTPDDNTPEPESPSDDYPAPHGEDEPTNPEPEQEPKQPTPAPAPLANDEPTISAPVKATNEPAPEVKNNESAPVKQEENTLPQTGQKDAKDEAIAGTALALVGLLGLTIPQKKKKD